MVTPVVLTLCILVALGVFFYQLWGRFRVLLSAAPVSRFDRIPERIRAVLVYAFGQRKFVRRNPGAERSAGWVHFFIFWGFIILMIQVITIFGRGYSESFRIPGFSSVYLLIQDITELILLLAVVVAFVRWIMHTPRLYGFLPPESRQRDKSHWEGYLILFFIAVIMLAGLVYDGGQIVSHPNNMQIAREARWQPISSLVGLGLAALGTGFALHASNVAWWTEAIVVLVFLNLLPSSKHFHLITAIPNVFFSKLEPKGQLSKQNLENDLRFGTSHIDQFTWKQMLDMFSCTECGRCSSNCPATATKKPLAPRQLLLDLRDYLYEHQNEVIEKTNRPGEGEGDGAEPLEVGENIVGPVIHDDTLWSCTSCRACEEACPVMIEYVDKIVDMRRHLVQEEARFPKELTRTFKNMETQSNPWGLDSGQRFEWAERMNVPTLADKPDAEYLYYVGCAGAYDDRNKKTTQAFVRVLQKAGVDFACLAREELCNGDTARRLGNEYLYQTMAQMLVETLNGYKVRKIIVNCPHCFNTIKNEYPQFGGSYEVVHASDLVQQLIASGRLKISGEFPKQTVYHDSCYYGRYNDVFDDPRTVLNRAGAKVQEMERHHKFSMCCGAGGGRMWMEEDPDKRVNLLRTEQALKTDPEVVAVSCPFCMTMLGDGIKAKELEEKVQTLDVMEIVDEVTRSRDAES